MKHKTGLELWRGGLSLCLQPPHLIWAPVHSPSCNSAPAPAKTPVMALDIQAAVVHPGIWEMNKGLGKLALPYQRLAPELNMCVCVCVCVIYLQRWLVCVYMSMCTSMNSCMLHLYTHVMCLMTALVHTVNEGPKSPPPCVMTLPTAPVIELRQGSACLHQERSQY